MKEVKDDVLNEMQKTFHQDYELINRQFNMLYDSKSVDEMTVPLEEFRQAGISLINKFYGR